MPIPDAGGGRCGELGTEAFVTRTPEVADSGKAFSGVSPIVGEVEG